MTAPAPKPATTLLVIAKQPVPGRVKTRLVPPCTHEQAAALAEAALADTLRTVLMAPAGRRVLVLDGEPGPWLPPGFDIVPQCGGPLDERLAAAFAAVRGPALLIGMDTPQVTPGLLAVDWRAADAVFGPAADGGFWALGLREPDPALLRGVPMSTSATGAIQRARLVAAGLRVAELPQLRDVDTARGCPGRGPRGAADPVRRAGARAGRGPEPGPHGERRPRGKRPRGNGVRTGAIALYEEALREQTEALVLRTADGRALPLPVSRWCGPPDSADEELLRHCRGPVLDVGCGPGRLTMALTERGIPALGVDISLTAVDRVRQAGAPALRRSVFDPLPGRGRWATVLLADGNIGIGGLPARLLLRCAELLAPGGRILIETEPGDVDEQLTGWLEHPDSRRGPVFPWARMGTAALLRAAADAGLQRHRAMVPRGPRVRLRDHR